MGSRYPLPEGEGVICSLFQFRFLIRRVRGGQGTYPGADLLTRMPFSPPAHRRARINVRFWPLYVCSIQGSGRDSGQAEMAAIDPERKSPGACSKNANSGPEGPPLVLEIGRCRSTCQTTHAPKAHLRIKIMRSGLARMRARVLVRLHGRSGNFFLLKFEPKEAQRTETLTLYRHHSFEDADRVTEVRVGGLLAKQCIHRGCGSDAASLR